MKTSIDLGLRPSSGGRKLVGRCPLHDDHRPSFEVDVATQQWRCYACSPKRAPLAALEARLGGTIDVSAPPADAHRRHDAVGVLRRWVEVEGVYPPEAGWREPRPAAWVARRGFDPAVLAGRALPVDDLAVDWLVAVFGDEPLEKAGLWPGLLRRSAAVVLAHDFAGRVVGGQIAVARPKAGGPKYLSVGANAPFGLAGARKATTIVVAEGATDFLAAHHALRAGKGSLAEVADPDAHVVGLIGAGHLPPELRALRPERVILALDPDGAGDLAAARLAKEFGRAEVVRFRRDADLSDLWRAGKL